MPTSERELALKMARGVQGAWACSWESQLSWNLAEYSVREVLCFRKRRSAVRARGAEECKEIRTSRRTEVGDMKQLEFGSHAFHRQLQTKLLRFSSC